MGITEVQRTLVKSPPELWAELSDQDSLSRLLSELGEIRIVSTVAETAVHWEADDASGSAFIKQAGWGTKVTLRATVTATDPPNDEAPAPALAAAHGSSPETTPVAATTPLAAPTPVTTPASASAPSPMTAAALRGSLESSPQPVAADAPTTAERPPAEERAVVNQSTSEEHADAAVDESPPEEPEIHVQAGIRAHDSEPAPEPTRRSFFARLFGRLAPEREEPDQQAGDDAGSPGTDDRPSDAEARPLGARGGDESHDPEVSPARDEPIQPTALEALQARFAARAPAPEPVTVPESPPVPAAPTAPASNRVSARPAAPEHAAAPEPPSAPGLPSTAPESAASESADGAVADGTEAPDAPSPPDRPSNLSTELRRAEEIDAEGVRAAPTEDQVEEILKGVLDRLGAAHHRPYSRA